MGKKNFEFRCRVKFLDHLREYSEESYDQIGHEYLGQKCCGQTMILCTKIDKNIKECPVGSCLMALNPICRCWNCYGKFHGSERGRNHHLKGTMDEYLIHRPLKVEFKFN